jgi:hypothetical protein
VHFAVRAFVRHAQLQKGQRTDKKSVYAVLRVCVREEKRKRAGFDFIVKQLLGNQAQ